VELPEPAVRQLIELAMQEPGMEITVDLERQRVAAGGFEASFALDPFFRECLLNGWDEVSLTLRQDADIARFESKRPAWLPTAG
jgi:3-isopropylmalate/(R)-2-methylmalate dehydratase small subunit